MKKKQETKSKISFWDTIRLIVFAATVAIPAMGFESFRKKIIIKKGAKKNE